MACGDRYEKGFWTKAPEHWVDSWVGHIGVYQGNNPPFDDANVEPQTKAEKNQARLKQLRGRAGRWA